MCADYWAFPVASLGPAVISSHRFQTGDYYENTYRRSDSLLTDVHRSCSSLTCLSRLGSGRSHHVPLHREPFHLRDRPPYTTSDFVSGMLTLAGPLASNFNGTVTPTAFTFSDGVQTFTNLNAVFFSSFLFVTGPTGQITGWDITVGSELHSFISTTNIEGFSTIDIGIEVNSQGGSFAFNQDQPGGWENRTAAADSGSTLSMLTLTLMALGVAARQFKRAAA